VHGPGAAAHGQRTGAEPDQPILRRACCADARGDVERAQAAKTAISTEIVTAARVEAGVEQAGVGRAVDELQAVENNHLPWREMRLACHSPARLARPAQAGRKHRRETIRP